ncbi:probable proline--tRNA ligase, mitochondrial [Thalassophryne amazonica]|uniref:probable proline--tRNA ligase, mitochondrial n=1 Tax=Thalassophryne amazonica TaxID=390379 RepID=UPI001471C021|nr:probable proline--tRNA ligase, mitochondrial [Thalassophryne amazonica]XP_034035465.1 probable proline--tRNA ligase, mitochondrial [Thalassophryne amazonica]XP_034035466.1 probable proline--tRNA ligase, mitochondrial [Thalassophryne amazonica]
MYKVWQRIFQHFQKHLIPQRRINLRCTEHTASPASTPSAHIRPTVRVSNLYQPSSLRDMGQDGKLPREMTCKSQRLMQQAGLIHPSSPGCYYYLPATVRSMEKLVRLIDQEMQSIGGQKLDMPSLCSADLWKSSERWNLMGKDLFRVKDRHGADYCLGPTHEEAVTSLVAHQATLSYKQLPLLLYQITRKFRDELKPRFGLLRGKEFYMKDMYSFDVNKEAAHQTYESVCQAYMRLFSRLGLHCIQVQADTGNIGGTLSHEFQLPADIGEDRLRLCRNCSFSANAETLSSGGSDCPQCKTGTLVDSKGIEVGHTFYLGKKYSDVFNATFSNAQSKSCVAEMGCFGLGVTRILAAAIEVMSTEESIRWPGLLAPYQVCVLPPKKGSKDKMKDLAEEVINTLQDKLPGLRDEVILDDRTHMTIGKRLKDANRLGYPYVIAIGQSALEEMPRFEVICQQINETMFLSKDGLLDLLGRVETV